MQVRQGVPDRSNRIRVRRGRRDRRRGLLRSSIGAIWSCLDFTLAGVAVIMLCLWPFVQTAQAQVTAPARGGSAAASELQYVRALLDAARAREAASRPAATRPDPLVVRAAHVRLRTPVAARSASVRIPGDAPIGLPYQPLSASAASAADLNRMLTITVVLKRSNQAGFDAYLKQVYDRRSPSYDHFLTQPELADHFGPTTATYHGALSWLRARGFRLVQGSANRLTLTMRATRAVATAAFRTPIRDARIGRRVVYSNTEAPALPAWLARDVQAISGLSDVAEPTASPATAPVKASSGKNLPPQCLEALRGAALTLGITALILLGGALAAAIAGVFYALIIETLTLGLATGYSLYSIFPQLPNIPNVPSTYETLLATGQCVFLLGQNGFSGGPGKAQKRASIASGAPASKGAAVRHEHSADASDSGQKIGLLEFDTYRASDVQNWLSLMNFPASTISQLSEVPVNGGVASPGSGESEVLIDIDTAIGEMPSTSTKYVVYDAPPSTSFEAIFNAMINDGDTVISNSWSQCEDQTPIAEAQAINSVLAQAAAGGITVLNGAGDGGSTCQDGSPNTVGVPSDSPEATAVGGTTFGAAGQSWWGAFPESPPSGQGGFGVSKYFARPGYQDGLTSASGRSVPDVAIDADPALGLEICQADDGGCPSGLSWGGTSMATPEMASFVAFLNQQLGHNVGDLNTVLYPMAGSSVFDPIAGPDNDFAHVGLGAPDFARVWQSLSGTRTGAVSPTQSAVVGLAPPADGTTEGYVQVKLEDANGFVVPGKSVSLSLNGCPNMQVSSPSGPSDRDGDVIFTLTDTVAETCTVTATDTTDNIVLSTQPTLTSTPPVATGAEISAEPSTVTNDGTSQATISVYLENGLGQPAAGKTVMLSENGGSATITPVSYVAVTGSNGVATFTATDYSQQSVSFTATDVTDGNTPVPGSAVVTFEPGGSSSSCADTPPTPVGGYTIGPWASGLAYNPQDLDIDGVDYYACSGIDQPAYDASGNLYVPDGVSGQIYVLGPSGGQASTADALPDATFSSGLLGGLAFGKDGSLYAGLPITDNSFFSPEVVQLDPTTGAIERVVATSASGLQDCPFAMAVDPLSGDLFTTDTCTFGSDGISQISDPQSASPTVSTYTSLPYDGGLASDGITFAPDGTMYVALPGADEVVSVTGTNGPATPVVTPVATGLSYEPAGVAVASTDAAGHATALYVSGSSGGTGVVSRVDLTASLPNSTTIATGSENLTVDALGPDGCVYISDLDQILRLSSGAACAGTSSNEPEITLEESSGSASPGTGSSVGFTANLENVSSPSGTPIHFTIEGPNFGVRLADASDGGQATVSYAGVYQGVDTVTAWAVVNGSAVTSAPLQVHWMAGKDTTFLDLNGSQQGGPLGQSATVTASLWDEAQSPASPVSGQQVALGLGGASCSAQTNGAGVASCKLKPSKVGLLTLSASYAGASQYTASAATNTFDATVGTPVDTALPKVSGTALPGNTLSCSKGSWSNDPTRFSYQWERGGRPIAGATKRTYVVQISDEAARLTCRVTASNSLGAGAPAASVAVLVAVKGTLKCPKPSGKLRGTSLGPLKLGMTRAAARRKLKRFGVTHNDFDNFCLYAGWGIRVGYPSTKLVKALPSSERGQISGRIVLALSANPFYALDGVRPGARLTAAVTRKLKLGADLQIGSNRWYIAPGKASNGVLKVRHGVIQEVGIANLQLTGGRAAQQRFLTSFDAARP